MTNNKTPKEMSINDFINKLPEVVTNVKGGYPVRHELVRYWQELRHEASELGGEIGKCSLCKRSLSIREVNGEPDFFCRFCEITIPNTFTDWGSKNA